MRIAIFTDTFFPKIDGVANVARQSAHTLAAAGHQVLVCAASSWSAKQLNRQLRENFEIITLPSLPLPTYPLQRIAFPTGQALRRLCRFRPDIIHSHTFFGVGWEAVACAKWLKRPLVGTHHTFFDHYLKHIKLDYSWGRKLSWQITVGYYNRCNLVTSPSRALAAELTARGLKRPIVLLPNGIDPLFFRSAAAAKEKGLALVYMGRLSYEKSIDQVVAAFSLLCKEKPAATLTLIGDGPSRLALERQASQLGIASAVRFTGLLTGEPLRQTLQSKAVFVTASKSENMPLSVLEAMAAGLPIVAVAEKGLPELVQDGINGFLAPADQPAVLAAKLLALTNQPGLLEKFGRASRAQAAHYASDQIIEKLTTLYNQLIKTA